MIAILLVLSLVIGATGVQAAGAWSQYGRLAPASSSNVGGFNSPSGMAVDGSGNIYVADRYNNRIQKYTASTGTWSTLGSGGPGSGPGEFFYPSDVAVDSAGNVYVADYNNHRIQKLDISTGVWSSWGKEGGVYGNGPGEFYGPSGVAVDASGNVYVADTSNHRIQKLDGSTGIWSVLGTSNFRGSNLGQFDNPHGVAVDDDGNLYVADSGNHRIQKLDISTGSWSEWKAGSGGSGSGLGEFNDPEGIALDGAGNIYVSDTGNHRIQNLEIAAGQWAQWMYPGPVAGTDPGEFKGPGSVAVDASGNVYVADTSNHRIQKLTLATGEWSVWGKDGGGSGNGPGEFNSPFGITVDSAGNVYVADTGNHRIQKLTLATGEWSVWGKDGGESGNGPGEFNRPYGVAVDSAGNVYVADTYNNRIQKLTAETGTWSSWGKIGGGTGSGPGEFTLPRGVAADSAGNVYVADTSNHRVQKLTLATDEWSVWRKDGGGTGSGPGEFNQPAGIAVDTSGNVYVADTMNNRIQKLTASTGVWREWSNTASADLGGFNRPAGVAVDSVGNVYVADTNNSRIQKLSMPGAPSGLTATAGDGRVVLAWNPVLDATGYHIFQSETADSYGNEVSGAAYSYSVTESVYTSTVTGLTNGTTYYFVVKAANDDGVGAASNQVSAVPYAPSPSGESGDNYPPVIGVSEPPEPAHTSAVVLVNGQAESAGTVVTTQRDGLAVTTVEVDQTKLEARLAAEGLHSVVTIPVPVHSEIVIGELNGQMVKIMENNRAVLEIQTDRAAYTLPAEQINIDAISAQLGNAVALQDIRVQIEIAVPPADMVSVVESAATEGSFTLIVPPLSFTVRGVVGDETIEVSQFMAYVERTVVIPDGVDPGKITTGVVVDPDGSVRHVPTKIEKVDGKYVARINSLTNSMYAVVWHPLEFGDVENHWAKEAINDLGSRMIVDGTGKGMFSPDREITRAEFAAIVVRGLGLRPDHDSAPFSDVLAEDWFSGAVNTAYAYGLIGGYGDGTFRPNEFITREQAMVILDRAMVMTGLRNTPDVQSTDEALRPFADAAELSPWATSGAANHVQAGIVTGRSATLLAPKAFMTRAEVAVTIRKLLQQSGLI